MSDFSSRTPLTSKPLTLPRSCSRVLSKLIALPPNESLTAAKEAYADASGPAQRHTAMRLRLRLLQEAMKRPARPAQPDITVIAQAKDSDPDLDTPSLDEPEEGPDLDEAVPPVAKTPTLMKMDLEGDALSLMMGALSGPDEDDMQA